MSPEEILFTIIGSVIFILALLNPPTAEQRAEAKKKSHLTMPRLRLWR